MSTTTGHENETVTVAGLKATIQDGGNKGILNKAICSTAGGTAIKVTNTVPKAFSLVADAMIIVKFTYGITVANAQLKIGDNDAKDIYYRGAALAANIVKSGDILTLQYNGTRFDIVNSLGETYESKQAASGGTDLSLVTTGEKYAWNDKISSSAKGAANGVASLDANGKVPSSQLPSYVDDVIEGYYKKADGKFYKESTYTTEITGESGKIYTDLSTDTTYRWSGTQFTQIKGDLAIGTTTGTAADGGIVNTHVNDTDIHVTLQDKSNWSGKQDALVFNTAYDATTNKAATMADVPDAQIQSDWNQTTSTAKDYIKNKPNLATVATSGSYNDLSNKPTIPTIEDFHEAVATLSATPTSSTLTYTRDGVTYEYKIGDEVRVADQEAEEGYKFYKLYDITGTVPNQEAVWGGLGSGGGSVTITGTIVVNLEEYINNSKTAGSGLVGAVITLTNTSDSETVGTHTIVSGETGYTFSGLTPMKNYSVSVSALSGYTQPEAQTVSELGIGASVTKTFQYQADEYTVAIASNQGSGDTGVSGGRVIYDETEYADGNTFKVAKGTSLSVTAKAVTGYRCTSDDGDLVISNKTITATYKTEVLTVTITKDQGDGDISQCNVVVSAGGSTLGTLSNGQSLKIAYGVNYTLTPSTAPLGYDAPAVVTKDWSDTPTKALTFTYEESKGVDLGLPSGILWAPQNVGAANPEDDGDYFSWGNVEGHTYESGYDFSATNWNASHGATLTGNIPQTVEFDAAIANMGAPWMMPTRDLMLELGANTDYEYTSLNGKNGYKFMKKSDHSVFIFIPGNGRIEGTTRTLYNQSGSVWTTNRTSSNRQATNLGFNGSTISFSGASDAAFGMAIRAVRYPNTCKIHLTSTDNSSVSGVKIKVSNSSVTLNVVTNSNGDAIFSLPNGTFSIESSTHALSVRTMVVSGNTTVNANSTSIIGNWIFERKGGLYDATQWAAAKQAGTVSDDDVIGIVVNTEEHKLMISPDSLGSMKIYTNATTIPTGMTAVTSQSAAEADFAGEANTLLMMNTYGTDSAYAAGATRNYSFGNGSKGYLPAFGELMLFYTSKSTINALITACGATAMDTTDYTWTSTYLGYNGSEISFWRLKWDDGTINAGNASYARAIRPFTQWKPISTKLHFIATDESSVAGMVLEITDGSGNSTYVKTGADGDAYASLDDGTYTVVAFSHTLSSNTFTVSGLGTVVNISANYQEYVDLGLTSGIKWATGNIISDGNGGYKVGGGIERGAYVSWGNIVPHFSSNGSTFDDGYEFNASYSSTPGASVSANISSSDSAHDAVLALLGSPWRLPTKDNFVELNSETDSEWTSVCGVAGIKFMKKSDHKIFVFFPAAGIGDYTSLTNLNILGRYWSSSWYSSGNAYLLSFNSSSIDAQSNNTRFNGRSLRAVR